MEGSGVLALTRGSLEVLSERTLEPAGESLLEGAGGGIGVDHFWGASREVELISWSLEEALQARNLSRQLGHPVLPLTPPLSVLHPTVENHLEGNLEVPNSHLCVTLMKC